MPGEEAYWAGLGPEEDDVLNPQEGQIVFVEGGIAQFRGGVFYTGMDEPAYTRPIQWEVKWWRPITEQCTLVERDLMKGTVWMANAEIRERLGPMSQSMRTEMKTSEPFELGLIRIILGLSPDGDVAAEVRRIKRENARLETELSGMREEIQRAIEDQRRSGWKTFPEKGGKG